MNAIGMPFQQIEAPKTIQVGSKQIKTEENTSSFQALLKDEKTTPLSIMDHVLRNNQTDEQRINMENASASIYNMIAGTNESENVSLSKKIGNEVDIKNMILEQWTTLGSVNTEQIGPEVITAIEKVDIELFSKFETLISQIENKQDIKKVAPKILELLEHWTTFEKKTSGDLSALSSLKSEGTKALAVWRELVQSFQKWDQIAAKHQYNNNAKVTSTDVAKWIGSALENQVTSDRPAGQQSFSTASITNMPVTRLEQYVIHVNQTKAWQPVDKQLIEQFQKITQSSKFSVMPNGTKQLSMVFRPDNLGEIMVRLVQVNGEMTAKILVSSQAAKEILESNIGQLRNMFSPTQVVIEKQELTAQQEQDLNKDEQEEQLTDQEQRQSQDSDQGDKQHSGEDFKTQFQELLMSEKV
ncbi:flagellar hook-length control protein FliK [Virgibacillus sp. NKC19-16]|uniref:flagellar hook-length control protein FliK n=1 Tax=Virgibacillus salidurans TaxID=2831673 RepID=UPI001F2B6FC6|nr:flagellar hook-length control protein FliK [Virgibacillus sp. NKC19-16]UJL47940.1 flagellar hook-length control protein FliK [Virgibacillus sp. NKC19-16]